MLSVFKYSFSKRVTIFLASVSGDTLISVKCFKGADRARFSWPESSVVRLITVDKDDEPDPDGGFTTIPGHIFYAIAIHIGDVFVCCSSGFARLITLILFEYGDAEVKVVSNANIEQHLRLKERPSVLKCFENTLCLLMLWCVEVAGVVLVPVSKEDDVFDDIKKDALKGPVGTHGISLHFWWHYYCGQ